MNKRILFVCLGNICRSPAAEGVFLHLLKKKGLSHHFVVDSAGTGGWHVGSPPDSRMRSAALRRGISLVSLARKIQIDDFHQFDLILTMDSDNLSAVKSLSVAADANSVATIKPMLSYSKKFNLSEVPDPYYGGEQGFDEVLDLLEDACEGLIGSFKLDL